MNTYFLILLVFFLACLVEVLCYFLSRRIHKTRQKALKNRFVMQKRDDNGIDEFEDFLNQHFMCIRKYRDWLLFQEIVGNLIVAGSISLLVMMENIDIRYMSIVCRSLLSMVAILLVVGVVAFKRCKRRNEYIGLWRQYDYKINLILENMQQAN